MKFQIIEQENARQQFIEKYGEQIQGVVSGFGPAGNCAKGIADLHRRTEVSQKANDRLLNALASVDDSRTIEELTADIQKHVTWNKLRMRGLRPWTEDKPMLAAINHGEFLINGFRKRDRQPLLYENRGRVAEQRRRSAATSRKVRLLRAHGLAQKVPRAHRNHLASACEAA